MKTEKKTGTKAETKKTGTKTKANGISPDQAGANALAKLIGVKPMIDRAWTSIDLDKGTMLEVKRGAGAQTLYPLLRTLFDFNPKSKLWVFRGFSPDLIAERAKLKGCKVENGEIIVVDAAQAQVRQTKKSQGQQASGEISELKSQISDLTSIVSTLMSKLGASS